MRAGLTRLPLRSCPVSHYENMGKQIDYRASFERERSSSGGAVWAQAGESSVMSRAQRAEGKTLTGFLHGRMMLAKTKATAL